MKRDPQKAPIRSDQHVGHYDVILAGGGAAGLSLAYHLSLARPGLSMLIIDEAVKDRNDHTWCFWSPEPSYLDDLAYRIWDRLLVVSESETLNLNLAPYRYRMVRALDFYRFMRSHLARLPNVHFRHGTVQTIADGPDRAEVLVNALTFTGDWVFDSRYRSSAYRPLGTNHHYLVQHFLGWEIESATPVFDPQTPTFFDFRTPQHGVMRFVYVLPYSETRGMVEYTLFSASLLPRADYEMALRRYLKTVLKVETYRILDEEQDLIPMTDHVTPRRAGHRVLNIGTRGGRVKASSGYAFSRIDRDSAAIVRSLTSQGHPFDLPTPPRRYHTFDAMLLHILEQQGHLAQSIFMQLFIRNPVQRVLRFLDEEGGLGENLQLMASVPPVPFLKAWLATKFVRGI